MGPEFTSCDGTLTHRKAKQDAGDVADTAAQASADGQPQTISDIDGNAAAQAGAGKAKDKVSAAVPDDAKSRARELTDRTKNYLSKKMPKDRREQTVWRLKKMILEIQGHADCKSTITLASQYAFV